jgi:hypothetical protein
VISFEQNQLYGTEIKPATTTVRVRMNLIRRFSWVQVYGVYLQVTADSKRSLILGIVFFKWIVGVRHDPSVRSDASLGPEFATRLYSQWNELKLTDIRH